MNAETVSLDPKKYKLVCPGCGTPQTGFAGVTPGHSQTVRKGAFWICANCGHLSRVGDSNLESISKEKFDALPNHIKQAVAAIIKTVKDTGVRTTDLN